MEICPGVAAGQVHSRHDLLSPALQQVPGAIGDALEEEFVSLQILVTTDQIHQVIHLGGPALEGCLRGGHGAVHAHDAAQLGSGGGVTAVGLLPQGCVKNQLVAQAEDLLQKTDAAAQALQRLHTGQSPGKFVKITDRGLHAGQIALEIRGIEPGIDRVQIPKLVHERPPLCILASILHQSLLCVNCP